MALLKPYDHGNYPQNGALGSSQALRTELDAIETGFDVLDAALDAGITGAAGSATTATTQAGIATAQAVISTAQAVIATTQAGISTTQAGIATTQAGLANSAKVAAEAARDSALAAYDSFDDRYLGAKAVEPTLENDGNPLQVGTLYWDSTLVTLRVYNGSAWLNLPATTAAAITNSPSGNLSATTVQAALDELDNEKLSNAAGAVTTDKLAFDSGALGHRNKIIGGDFTTNPWQRGTSFTAAIAGAYIADRWVFGNTTTAVVNAIKTSDAPTAVQAGVFTQHCLHVDVTTADAAMAAGESSVLTQRIEGLNAASFGFGQSGTRYVTLSFWHKHTKTGTYCVSLANASSDRSYVAEYTQDVTDTWEKATITIQGDTSGTWLYDTNVGLVVRFCLATGSTFQTTANTWTAGNFFATANQVNALDNVANNFKIALVQLEAGSIATPFETRSVGQELALCQRYYEQITGIALTTANSTFEFKVTKRATPTMGIITLASGSGLGIVALNPNSVYQSVGNSVAATFVASASAEL